MVPIINGTIITGNWFVARIVNTVRAIAMGKCLVANSEMDYVSLIGSALTVKDVKEENNAIERR